jgi:hypothetical protein
MAWHHLFDASDQRGTLTWRNRLSNLRNAVVRDVPEDAITSPEYQVWKLRNLGKNSLEPGIVLCGRGGAGFVHNSLCINPSAQNDLFQKPFSE